MSRAVPEVHSLSNSAPRPDTNKRNLASRRRLKVLESWLIRLFIAVGTTALCYNLRPFGLRRLSAAGVGLLLALLILLAELRLRRAAFNRLLGGALGGVLGLVAALLMTLVISGTGESESTKTFLEYASLFTFAYLGFVLGSQRGGELNAGPLGEMFSSRGGAKETYKLLDTSVLIDGRIADICEAQFLDGILGVPQFVLHELQLVADSADSLKRQRGRRGLEVLQRIQKMPHVEVRILEKDLPASGEVDHKLLELARQLNAKIITNDFNLNKVATVQGLAVLNVNQLANALKPVVLPGEPMRVLILREGKEPYQGVAFLDDGTMVVVDGARRLINKRVDILVTSVHQTAAGKMIFGRLDEQRSEPRAELRTEQSNGQPNSLARPAVASASGRGETSTNAPSAARSRPGNGSHSPEPPQVDCGGQRISPETDTPDLG